jgi:DNA-binding beta-propeller fold protein YncE
MNLDACARASAQAIDRSATRLDPAAGLEDMLHRHRRRQQLQRAGAAAVALLVMVVAIWAGVLWRGPTPVQPGIGPVTRIRVGPTPVSVAVTPGAAWVLNSGNATIARIDPNTGQVQASFPASFAAQFAGTLVFATAGEGRLWVVHAPVEPGEGAISAIDPSTGQPLFTFAFGGHALEPLGKQGDLAVGSGAVLVALRGTDQVRRFDAATGKLLDQFPLPEPTALAVDGQTLWVATADGRLRSIDTKTGAIAVRATTARVARIRVGQGGIWLMTVDGKVLRLDPRTGRILAQVPGSFRAADLAVGTEGVWVYDQHQGALLRIDPGTNQVDRTIQVITRPLVELHSRVLAVGDGAVWVVDKAGEALVRVDPYR